MVAQEEIPQQSENTGAFGKLKQTLSSSLLTAQDKGITGITYKHIYIYVYMCAHLIYNIFCFIFFFTVSKMSPRPSLVPDHIEHSQLQVNPIEIPDDSNQNANSEKNDSNKTNRAGSCRVCLKSFKAEDFSKTCFECKYRVCEDCASYSKIDSTEDLVIFLK